VCDSEECCSVLQCVAVCCSVLRCVAYWEYCILLTGGLCVLYRNVMYSTPVNTILQHTATHCNTLQHTATHRHTLPHPAGPYKPELKGFVTGSWLHHTHATTHCTPHAHTLQTWIGRVRDWFVTASHTYCNTLHPMRTPYKPESEGFVTGSWLQHTHTATHCTTCAHPTNLNRKVKAIGISTRRDDKVSDASVTTPNVNTYTVRENDQLELRCWRFFFLLFAYQRDATQHILVQIRHDP